MWFTTIFNFDVVVQKLSKYINIEPLYGFTKPLLKIVYELICPTNYTLLICVLQSKL
jgi:hypothetical protein